MLDINNINQRYFEISFAIEDGEHIRNIELKVLPPKVKTLRKFSNIKTDGDDVVNQLVDAVVTLLNRNSSGYKVSQDIIEELDLDQIDAIFTSYMEWVHKTKNDPN